MIQLDNIYTYMDWRGDLSFFQDEWNEVDSMIFAQMVYVRFENLKHVNWNEGITIASVCKELKKSYKIKGDTKSVHNNVNYVVVNRELETDEIVPARTLVAAEEGITVMPATPVLLTITYDVDMLGGGDSFDRPDEISDNRELFVTYQSGNLLFGDIRPISTLDENTRRVGNVVLERIILEQPITGASTGVTPQASVQTVPFTGYREASWGQYANLGIIRSRLITQDTIYTVSYEAIPTQPITPVTPTVTPTTPTTPATPAVTPVTPVVIPTPQTPQAQEPQNPVDIQDPATPQDNTPEVNIEDQETPKAESAISWALVNLILMIVTLLVSAFLLIGYFIKKRDEEQTNENEKELKRKGIARISSLLPALIAVIAFFLTENVFNPIVMTDQWTLLMVIILVVQIVICFLSLKKWNDNSNHSMRADA